MAAVFPTTPVDIIGFTHTKKIHTSSCLKKITGEAMSLRWQSSTMCSSSLSSCCTSWTWCSFQPCPVGNQPVFSLAVCLCVCVMLSSYVVPSFQRHKLPVLGPPAWIGHRDSVWHARMNATLILYQNATNATPKACLLDSAGLPRGGHILHFLFYFSIFLSSLVFFSLSFFTLYSQTKQVSAWKQCDVSTSPSFSFTNKFSPLPLFLYFLLSLLPFLFFSISLSHTIITDIYKFIHQVTHTYTHTLDLVPSLVVNKRLTSAHMGAFLFRSIV